MEEERAVLRKVFSSGVKPEKAILLDGARNDARAVYNFHESILKALGPSLKEGDRSIILATLINRRA